jgi:hypothetical protein
MTSKLPDWPRSHFTQPGGMSYLFYVVYGQFEPLPTLSTSDYRSEGVPSGLVLSRFDAEQDSEVLDSFREGYLWNELRSANPDFASQIAEPKDCMILRGEIEESDTLNYLRDSVGLLTFLLDHGGITVYDPFMFRWWTPDEWRTHIFDPGESIAHRHVVILTSGESEPSLTWFHTRGMRKFGRPDLSIHNVAAKYNDAIIELFERFIEFQAFGGIISEGQVIRMKGLTKGMTCHHRGDLDDPDFNNVHVEIVGNRRPKSN